MLKEIYQYLTTPCKPVFRKLGYLSEIIAINSKHLRFTHLWQPHLAKCHQHILSAATECSQHRKAIIMGAGLAYDVPVAELSHIFEEVILVDVVFMGHTRKLSALYANICLVEADVTGMIENIESYDPDGGLPAGQPCIPGYDENTDLVVSLNLFSQLGVVPAGWLHRKLSYSEEQCASWARQVMALHLQMLSCLNCNTLLIGDLRHEYCDSQGQLVEVDDFCELLNTPDFDDSWEWTISPLGEIDKNHQMQSQVAAWHHWQDTAYTTFT